jgi:hypothetical protein
VFLLSQGRVKTIIANETIKVAIDNGPNMSGQMIKIITVPTMIPTPDQKKAVLTVSIAQV